MRREIKCVYENCDRDILERVTVVNQRNDKARGTLDETQMRRVVRGLGARHHSYCSTMDDAPVAPIGQPCKSINLKGHKVNCLLPNKAIANAVIYQNEECKGWTIFDIAPKRASRTSEDNFQ